MLYVLNAHLRADDATDSDTKDEDPTLKLRQNSVMTKLALRRAETTSSAAWFHYAETMFMTKEGNEKSKSRTDHALRKESIETKNTAMLKSCSNKNDIHLYLIQVWPKLFNFEIQSLQVQRHQHHKKRRSLWNTEINSNPKTIKL